MASVADSMMRLGRLAASLLAFAGGAGTASAACLPTNPDISIYGIELGDPLSTALVLGTDYAVADDENGIATATFTSTAETEVLQLYRVYGDKSDVFEAAEVLAAADLDADAEATLLDTPLFQTGRGVRLGMTRKDILDRFGACATTPGEAGDGSVVLRYEITDIATSELLKAHNMPAYFAEYTFKGDHLVRFGFGFSTP